MPVTRHRATYACILVPSAAVAGAGKVGGIVGQVGELVEDNLGAERGQRLSEGVSVEHIADRGQRAKLAQQADLPRRPSHPRHHMAIGGKQRDQADTDDTAGPSEEDPPGTTAYPQPAAATPRDTGPLYARHRPP